MTTCTSNNWSNLISQVGKGTLKERALLCDTGTSCEMEFNKATPNQAVTLPYLRVRLVNFTLANTRRFYSLIGCALGVNG